MAGLREPFGYEPYLNSEASKEISVSNCKTQNVRFKMFFIRSLFLSVYSELFLFSIFILLKEKSETELKVLNGVHSNSEIDDSYTTKTDGMSCDNNGAFAILPVFNNKLLIDSSKSDVYFFIHGFIVRFRMNLF